MKKVLLLSMIALLSLVSCKRQEQIKNDTDDEYDIIITCDSIQDEDEPTNIDTTDVRIWSSNEIKLPKGTVYDLDCAGCQTEDEKPNVKDNYVTIKRPNNILTIVRDIDEDLLLNLHVGDLIQ